MSNDSSSKIKENDAIDMHAIKPNYVWPTNNNFELYM
jgi:hypothetical protein